MEAAVVKAAHFVLEEPKLITPHLREEPKLITPQAPAQEKPKNDYSL